MAECFVVERIRAIGIYVLELGRAEVSDHLVRHFCVGVVDGMPEILGFPE